MGITGEWTIEYGECARESEGERERERERGRTGYWRGRPFACRRGTIASRCIRVRARRSAASAFPLSLSFALWERNISSLVAATAESRARLPPAFSGDAYTRAAFVCSASMLDCALDLFLSSLPRARARRQKYSLFAFVLFLSGMRLRLYRSFMVIYAAERLIGRNVAEIMVFRIKHENGESSWTEGKNRLFLHQGITERT